MYRKSLEMGENNVAAKETCAFVRRVAGLPVVHAVIVSTTVVYNKAKESNGLVKCTLNAAEKTVYVAAERAKPVLVKLEMPIGLADNFACMTLDRLEKNIPIITKTPAEIVADAKNMYDSTIAQPVMVRYNTAKALGLQKANAVKDYGMSTANVFLDTKYGHSFVGTLDTILIKADGCIDNYLPSPHPESQHDEPKIINDGNPMSKAIVVSKKVSHRLISHAHIKLQAAKKRMDEIVSALHLTLNLILAKNDANITNKALTEACIKAQARVLELWTEFNRGNPDVPGDKTLEQKVFFVMTRLAAQLNSTYQKTAATLALLPGHIQPTVSVVQNYITDLYSQFADAKSWNDVSNVVVLQMRDGIKNLRVLYSQLYDSALNLWAISWLVKANRDERKVVRNGSVMGHVTPVPSDDSPAESEGSRGEEQHTLKTNFNSSPANNCCNYEPNWQHTSSDMSD